MREAMLEPSTLRGTTLHSQKTAFSCPLPKLSAGQSNLQFATLSLLLKCIQILSEAEREDLITCCTQPCPEWEAAPCDRYLSWLNTTTTCPVQHYRRSQHRSPCTGQSASATAAEHPPSSCPKLWPLRNEKLLILYQYQTAGPRWINLRTQGV